jgi:hypothetical protein
MGLQLTQLTPTHHWEWEKWWAANIGETRRMPLSILLDAQEFDEK